MTNIKRLLARAKDIRCRRKERVMQLCETLSLGDRRFLALVKVEGQKLLVGAAGSSISLLGQFPSRQKPEPRGRQVDSDAPFNIEECKLWK